MSIIIHYPNPNGSYYISLNFCNDGFIMLSLTKINDIFL